MSDLNLLYADVEDDLRASVRQLIADRCNHTALVGTYDGDRSVIEPLWTAIARDLDLAGILVPEDRGGAGGSVREAGVILEELGRAVAPVPFLTSSVIATTVLVAGERGSAADALLADMAAGKSTATLAIPVTTTPWSKVGVARVDGDRLVGRITSVAGALEADVLLVPVVGLDGIAVHAVPADAATIDPVVSLDMTRQLADVTVDTAVGAPLLSSGSGESAIRQALFAGAALLASEQLGIAQRCLQDTVAYVNQRRQFGRVVGAFQALKHRLADLYLATESAAVAARHAAAALATGDSDSELATLVAQAWCSDVAVKAAEEAIQLHGGIGMTWEHPVHLYLKRAKSDQMALGTPAAYRSELAWLIDLPAVADTSVGPSTGLRRTSA